MSVKIQNDNVQCNNVNCTRRELSSIPPKVKEYNPFCSCKVKSCDGLKKTTVGMYIFQYSTEDYFGRIFILMNEEIEFNGSEIQHTFYYVSYHVIKSF